MVLHGNSIGDNAKGSSSAMILTVSLASGHYAATMNTLKYGNLVGVAGGNRKIIR